MAEKTISQIVNGIAPISHETAGKLELVTGVPASFWNRRESSYREGLARREEKKKLAGETEWLKQIPVKVLIERGFVEGGQYRSNPVRSILAFFGVSSVEAWRNAWEKPVCVQFRGGEAQERRPGYVAAWLRMGEIQAEQIECKPFDAAAFRKVLSKAREMTLARDREWPKELRTLCAAAGVCFVMTKEIPTASVSGATRWLTKDKALLQLSLKYKKNDQFWFSFFHEAGHILLHGKRQVFVEFSNSDDTKEEREADRFARDILIPPTYTHHLPGLKFAKEIERFAAVIGIDPGIVVGRLQRDGILKRAFCNNLKRTYKW